MFGYIKTIRTYIFWFLICIFFILICLPFALLPARIRYENRVCFFITSLWCKLLVFFSFIFVRVEGGNNLPEYPNNPAILVANHSSALDIFLIESIIGSYPRVWMSKDLYGKIPIFSIIIKRMHVLVKRENPRKALEALLKVYNLVKNRNSHVVLFPEGRRFDDGKVHVFLPGFAILAKKLNRPVIPIAIKGVNKIMSKKKFVIDSRASDVKIIIGEPVFCGPDESERDFVKRVRDWYLKCIF
jgi:1-acyl-sn-glycerol-3-phosphate acyltransferase